MPTRVRQIQRAIEERLDFSTLADGGEDAVVEYGRSIGANGRALICQWQQTGMAKQWTGQQAARPTQRQQAARVITESVRTSGMEDLDHWASDDTEPIDDDPPDDMPTCSGCGGSGRGRDGGVCPICNGKGRIPAEDQPDDGEDDDDREEE